MPRFDLPGREQETRIIMHRDGREYVYQLPYQTEDEREIRMLRDQGCVVVERPKPAPAPEPAPSPPEPEEKPKTRKGGDA